FSGTRPRQGVRMTYTNLNRFCLHPTFTGPGCNDRTSDGKTQRKKGKNPKFFPNLSYLRICNCLCFRNRRLGLAGPTALMLEQETFCPAWRGGSRSGSVGHESDPHLNGVEMWRCDPLILAPRERHRPGTGASYPEPWRCVSRPGASVVASTPSSRPRV